MRKQFIKQNGWWEESERRFWRKKINTDFNVHNSLNHHLNTRTDHLCSYATHIHQQQCMDANTMNRFLSPLYHIFFLFLSLAMSLVCLVCVYAKPISAPNIFRWMLQSKSKLWSNIQIRKTTLKMKIFSLKTLNILYTVFRTIPHNTEFNRKEQHSTVWVRSSSTRWL